VAYFLKQTLLLSDIICLVQMVIERANKDYLREILALQKLAYQSEAELYDDHSIPPLTQTIEGIEGDFRSHLFLKATSVIFDSPFSYTKDSHFANYCSTLKLANYSQIQSSQRNIIRAW
jgi:hypothetical protein